MKDLIISKISSFLIEEKFILNKTEEANNYVYNYSKNEDASIFRIGYVIEEKNKENVFWGFSLSLNFLYLEEIATPILVKNNLLGRSLQPKDVYNSFFVDFDFEIPIVNMEVVTKEDVDYIKNLFLKFYKEKALPFFEKWKDLTVLYEYIKDKTEEELWDILGQFAPM
ncbi:hypothetical protein ACTZMI_11640, partial [Ornithobacterium rhinotracheale]